MRHAALIALAALGLGVSACSSPPAATANQSSAPDAAAAADPQDAAPEGWDSFGQDRLQGDEPRYVPNAPPQPEYTESDLRGHAQTPAAPAAQNPSEEPEEVTEDFHDDEDDATEDSSDSGDDSADAPQQTEDAGNQPH
jgi:hypothetical protein